MRALLQIERTPSALSAESRTQPCTKGLCKSKHHNKTLTLKQSVNISLSVVRLWVYVYMYVQLELRVAFYSHFNRSTYKTLVIKSKCTPREKFSLSIVQRKLCVLLFL